MNSEVNLDQLDQLLEEKRYWIKVLGLWKHAKDYTSHTSDTVQAFTFRDEYLTPAQAEENGRRRMRSRSAVYSGATHHNALRLKDDTLVSMPLIDRPEPPGHMKCTFTEKY